MLEIVVKDCILGRMQDQQREADDTDGQESGHFAGSNEDTIIPERVQAYCGQ
jgi:hypothetical protein